MLISLIVSTYNRPDALNLVLQSLNQQTDTEFEVIVADDGSKEDTRQLVHAFQKNFFRPLLHAWHEDTGFRLAAVRNLAVKHSSGSYLIFLDGDCIVQNDFIANHRRLSEQHHFVTGSRVLLNPSLTDHILSQPVWNFSSLKKHLVKYRINGSINKLLCFYLKLGNLRMRYHNSFKWRGIKGCNFACWRQDFEQVKGYDEGFEGWGHEDADLVFRLHLAGLKRKTGALSTEVLHLYHPENNRSQADKNKAKVLQRMAELSGR